MADCIFCKIASGEIPSNIVSRDGDLVAFRDIDPKAPTHILVVPSQHIATLQETGEPHTELLGRMVQLANTIAQSEGIAQRGYRIVFNCGPEGGQSVDHIHLHLLGGRAMHWPPG